MSLYNEWKRLASKERSQNEYNKFWGDFFEKEKKNYEYILEHKDEVVGGKITDISQTFDMDKIALMGFIDGINTSLKSEIDLDSLTEESEIKLDIDFEKLYYNMLDANADWLCNLPQWEDVLSSERRSEITKEYKKANTAVRNKAGRNDPCPCGSGKKYKKCCGANV